MDLARALRITTPVKVAFVGAGGKTTALFQLARQLEGPVLVTATTHLAARQLERADRHLVADHPKDIRALEADFPPGVTLVTGPWGADERTRGVDDATLETLRGLADRREIPLLIEADGARQRPLKAPAEHEPALPGFVNVVVVVAGLSGLGGPLDESRVHRPELFAALAGTSPGDEITAEALAMVLASEEGGLKNAPPGARRVALLNQADTPEREALAHGLVPRLLPPYHAVLVASLAPPDGGEGRVIAAHEPVAGVVLAAGGSERLGEPKQLLTWRGQPFIRRVAQTALEAGLRPVVVVTGAHAGRVEPVVEGLPLLVVRNRRWEEGQSTSVKLGLRSLPPESGAAVFLLVDQPQVPATLLRSLVAAHAGSLAPIVAPQVDGQRANPVLFDRLTFADFEALEGDVGGRALFSRHRVTWVPWLDASLTLDVDTPQDYQKLLEYEG